MPLANSAEVSWVFGRVHMKSDCSYEAIEWLGLHLEVPQGWQIVRHGLSANLGNLTFTDRYAERLNLTWRKIAREPDLEKMVLEQRAKDEKSYPNETVSQLTLSGWHGYRLTGSDRTWLRAVRYETVTGQLLEVVLTLRTKHPKSAVLSEQLVCGIAATKDYANHPRLCAFDICAELPTGLVLTKTVMVPASTTLEFDWHAPGKSFGKPATAVIRRLGMADSWYRGNPFRLLVRESPKAEFRSPQELTVGAHVVTYAEGDTTEARVSRWLGRASRCRALLWHCEAENAVYYVSTRSYDREALLPSAFHLRCCKSNHTEGGDS